MLSISNNMISHYGYVPFKHFQITMIVLQLLLITYSKQVNDFMDQFFPKENELLQHIKRIILSIPIILIGYYDILYSSYSLKNFGISVDQRKIMDNLLMVLGAYGFIQVLAQDGLGVEATKLQSDTAQNPILFSLMSLGMAYSITHNHSFSMIAVLLYYHIKYVIYY